MAFGVALFLLAALSVLLLAVTVRKPSRSMHGWRLTMPGWRLSRRGAAVLVVAGVVFLAVGYPIISLVALYLFGPPCCNP